MYKLGIHTGYGTSEYSGRYYEFAHVYRDRSIEVNENYKALAIL
jgi:hypothetical protein